MSRRKTYPNPTQQWDRTVSYIDLLHRTKWMQWQAWLRRYEFRVRWLGALQLDNDGLRAKHKQELDAGPRVERDDHLCIVTQPDRLMVAGDVLVASHNNGMDERFPVFGVTSKGARLSHCWRPFNTTSAKGVVELVELPGDFIGMRWNDPAIGRFVVDLRASRCSRVGACSPATNTPGGEAN